MISQTVIDAQVNELLEGASEGADLTDGEVILLNYALHAGSSVLDISGTEEWQRRALAAGITPPQLHEIITLMSAIGVHVFFESTRSLERAVRPAQGWGDLDPERMELWDRHVGSRSYWNSMQSEIPGFLEALLRMSPEVFEAFIRYVGIPFRTNEVSHVMKELISMAADGSTAHQYLPGMRMHLRNALYLGAGKLAIHHAMRIAAESPEHVGVS